METFVDLYTAVTETLPQKHANRDLEEYLRALLSLALDRKNEMPSIHLFYQLLDGAFTAPPLAFQDEWLAVTQSPDDNPMSYKFTNPEIFQAADLTTGAGYADFTFLQQVLIFQIADLHRMRNKELKDEMRYFGVTSPTGNAWYNFDPYTNLECGLRCLEDNLDLEDENGQKPEPIEISWKTLGQILEMGRVYE